MTLVPVIPPLPVQPPDLVVEDPMAEWEDRLVPVQDDELPQGVLELMAPLLMRHRPLPDTGRARSLLTLACATAAVESDPVRSPTTVAALDPQTQAQPPSSRPMLSQWLPQWLPATAEVEATAPPGVQQVTRGAEPPLTERPSTIVEPSLPETVSHPQAPEYDEQKPEALPSLPNVRHGPRVAPVPVPAPATPPAPPSPEAIIETLPIAERGLLQVPFNKGIASGQVTISRLTDEPTRTLQLSPSNTQVFEQLRMSLEHVREPAWRLTDSGGDQPRQGSRQTPDDEQAEEGGQGA